MFDMWSYLGQNFLVDMKIKHFLGDKIAQMYHDLWCEALIEIGPGKWALTKLIWQITPNFLVIEKDELLVKDNHLNVAWLESVEVLLQDVLTVDVPKLLSEKWLNPSKTLIVGNLPYYITSPIFRVFFGYGEQHFAGGVFMIQKEVADKISEDAGKKSFLRWLLNYAHSVRYLKTVPANAFKPAPKVTSAIVGLTGKASDGTEKEYADLLVFLDLYCPYSRKTLGAISTMLNKKWLNQFEIPEQLRPKRLEECGWAEIIDILNLKK